MRVKRGEKNRVGLLFKLFINIDILKFDDL